MTSKQIYCLTWRFLVTSKPQVQCLLRVLCPLLPVWSGHGLHFLDSSWECFTLYACCCCCCCCCCCTPDHGQEVGVLVHALPTFLSLASNAALIKLAQQLFLAPHAGCIPAAHGIHQASAISAGHCEHTQGCAASAEPVFDSSKIRAKAGDRNGFLCIYVTKAHAKTGCLLPSALALGLSDILTSPDECIAVTCVDGIS